MENNDGKKIIWGCKWAQLQTPMRHFYDVRDLREKMAWKSTRKNPERRRRDNMRRRARHRVGTAGLFKCAICKKYRLRQHLEIDHTKYSGYNGRYRLICKAHHYKKHGRQYHDKIGG